jgi:hypothetical protein
MAASGFFQRPTLTSKPPTFGLLPGVQARSTSRRRSSAIERPVRFASRFSTSYWRSVIEI